MKRSSAASPGLHTSNVYSLPTGTGLQKIRPVHPAFPFQPFVHKGNRNFAPSTIKITVQDPVLTTCTANTSYFLEDARICIHGSRTVRANVHTHIRAYIYIEMHRRTCIVCLQTQSLLAVIHTRIHSLLLFYLVLFSLIPKYIFLFWFSLKVPWEQSWSKPWIPLTALWQAVQMRNCLKYLPRYRRGLCSSRTLPWNLSHQ